MTEGPGIRVKGRNYRRGQELPSGSFVPRDYWQGLRTGLDVMVGVGPSGIAVGVIVVGVMALSQLRGWPWAGALGR